MRMKRDHIYLSVIVIFFILNLSLVFSGNRRRFQNRSPGSDENLNQPAVEAMISVVASSHRLSGCQINILKAVDVSGVMVNTDSLFSGGPRLAVFLSGWVCSPCADRLFEELLRNNREYLTTDLVIITENWNIRNFIMLAQKYNFESNVVLLEGRLSDPKLILDKPALFSFDGVKAEVILVYDDFLKDYLPEYLNMLPGYQ